MDETADQELPLKLGSAYAKKENIDKKHKKRYSGYEYYLIPSQVQKMISVASTLRDRLLIRLLDITGGRRFEISEMRIEKIDFEQKKYLIDRGKGGSKDSDDPEEKRSRPVDLDDEELLKDLKMFIGKRTSGWLFESSHKGVGHINLSTINRIVAKAGKLAGLNCPNYNPKYRNIYPHLFRHGVGRRPIPLAAKQKLLGHRDAKTTLGMYGQLTFEDAQKYAREAREKLKPKENNNEVDKLDKLAKRCNELGISVKDYLELVKEGKI